MVKQDDPVRKSPWWDRSGREPYTAAEFIGRIKGYKARLNVPCNIPTPDIATTWAGPVLAATWLSGSIVGCSTAPLHGPRTAADCRRYGRCHADELAPLNRYLKAFGQ